MLVDEIPKWTRSGEQVAKDIVAREAFGLKKYGKYLTRETDEDMLRHLYEELMDASVYIKTLINQRDNNLNEGYDYYESSAKY